MMLKRSSNSLRKQVLPQRGTVQVAVRRRRGGTRSSKRDQDEGGNCEKEPPLPVAVRSAVRGTEAGVGSPLWVQPIVRGSDRSEGREGARALLALKKKSLVAPQGQTSPDISVSGRVWGRTTDLVPGRQQKWTMEKRERRLVVSPTELVFLFLKPQIIRKSNVLWD